MTVMVEIDNRDPVAVPKLLAVEIEVAFRADADPDFIV